MSTTRRSNEVHAHLPVHLQPITLSRSETVYEKSSAPFTLDKRFVDSFRLRTPPFGFNGLGELVYQRTYSRVKDDGEKEQWVDTLERVVNGTFQMQQEHIEKYTLGWNPEKAQESAQEMFTRMFDMRFLPPGRGLYSMGSELTTKRRIFSSLNNCGFVSTEKMCEDPSDPFLFLFDMSMLGCGIGFDLKGAGTVLIQGPKNSSDTKSNESTFVVPDCREGWVEALKRLLDAYFFKGVKPSYDFSQIRPYGAPIKGFGGVASGPQALVDLLKDVEIVLDRRIGQAITVTDIVDIQNLIGRAVVSGNVRRTAEIAFGDAHSEEFLNLKNYKKNPEREAWGWTSNNSVFGEIGMDYSHIADSIVINGEPGIAWLDNMKRYSRMNGSDAEYKDYRVKGGNPCLEQSLESYELCCLVETFPARHETKEDFILTLKWAYLYSKTVSLGETHWPKTNRVLLRNRRIGTSVSGIAQFLAKHSMEELRIWLEDGYKEIQRLDRVYSDWLAIPLSIKTTSVKPSGTVSLLAGSTPGIHYPESRFYIRRMRLATNSPLVPDLKKAGYHVEYARYKNTSNTQASECVDEKTSVVEFPIDVGEGVRVQKNVCLWEQLHLAAFMQRHWADNQVSATITFDPEHESSQIAPALNYFQYHLKGISFLPRCEEGRYPQMPYQEITEDRYHEMQRKLSRMNYSKIVLRAQDSTPDRFCDGDVCTLVPQQSPTAKEEDAKN